MHRSARADVRRTCPLPVRVRYSLPVRVGFSMYRRLVELDAFISREELVASLKSGRLDVLAERGLSVESDGDVIDEPSLVGPDGQLVETWRTDYPYDELLDRPSYESEKRFLQIELLKAQDWIVNTGQRLVVVFEGRDAAGKGGSIKRFTENLNPRSARVVALGVPSERERGQWYFQRYVAQLPTAGEMVLFDRSWYNRAVVEPVMGFCTDEQHRSFMRHVPIFEDMIGSDGTTLVKLWFSVTQGEQIARFAGRGLDPVRRWKLSPMDIASLDRWDDFTAAKEAMFAATHTDVAPWTVVQANDKKRSRLQAMRHVLSELAYPDKDVEGLAAPDPLLVGSPSAATKS